MTETRAIHWALLASTLVLAPLLLPSCGDDDDGGCRGGCECRGDECVCPSTGDCAVECVADCDLQCAGSGDCYFGCGDDCLTTCTGSGNCIIDVGEGSVVECTGAGDCDIACHGDCSVHCPGSGDCIVRCHEGVVCDFVACERNAIECPDGVLVCGGGECDDPR